MRASRRSCTCCAASCSRPRRCPPAREVLATLPSDVHVDNFGNAWVTRGGGRPHVLVLAHRDAPGWVVSQVTKDGYLRLQRLGSGATPLIDQFLVGKRMVVYTRR